MNDRTGLLTDNVNVTVHQVALPKAECSYAKVKRTTAYIGNVVTKAMEKEKLMSRETLLYAAGVLRNGYLDLLKEGNAVDLLEMGILYLKPDGSMETLSPDISDVPAMTLAFTPSELALSAVKNVVVAANVSTTNEPILSSVYNVTTLSETVTLTGGNVVRISGKRLKVAGEVGKVGVFFAPAKADGSYNADSSEWICIAENALVDNTNTKLLFSIPQGISTGNYRLIVRTAYGSGSRINKTLRTGIYKDVLTITGLYRT